jgi:hypothetical protein
MKLTHNVKVNVEFHKDNTPDYVLSALVNYSEENLEKLLTGVFTNALDEIGALKKINENNSYAKVSWAND